MRALREGPPVASAGDGPERETLSLADRFGAILESGRRVVSTFDSAEVAASVGSDGWADSPDAVVELFASMAAASVD